MELTQFLLVLYFLSHSFGVEGLECYQCTHLDEECDTKPKKEFLKECNFIVTKAQCFPNETNSVSGSPACQQIQADCQSTPPVNCTSEQLQQTFTLENSFCRKTILKVHDRTKHTEGDIAVERYQVKARVTRDCGYSNGTAETEQQKCIRLRNPTNALVICSCKENGCNKVPPLSSLRRFPFALISLSYILI